MRTSGPRRRAGGRAGYLLKDADEDEIATVLRGVARGEAIFGPGPPGRMLDHLCASHDGRRPADDIRSRN